VHRVDRLGAVADRTNRHRAVGTQTGASMARPTNRRVTTFAPKIAFSLSAAC